MVLTKQDRKKVFDDYAALGIKCIPVKGKVRITSDDEVYNIEDDRFEDCGVGILTGKQSGLVVIDIDGETNHEFVKELNCEETRTCKTKRGRHYYFRLPESTDVRNGQDILQTKATDGFAVDIRGNGGYVVAPPSEGYSWEGNSKTKILPNWLLRRINEQKETSGFLESLKGMTEGEGRHQTALRVIGSYIKCGLKGDILWATIVGWNRGNTPPLPEEWLESKVQEIIDKESSKSSTVFLPMKQQIASYTQFLKTKGVHKEPELTSGFEKLDTAIWGYNRGELIGIAGKPNSGKTLVMLKSALDNISRKKKVLYFPTEASRNAIFSRLISMKFGVNSTSLRRSSFTPQEQEKLNREVFPYFIEEASNYLFLYEHNAPHIEEIQSAVDKVNPDVLYIDFFQHTGVNKDNHKECEDFVVKLKDMGKKHNMAVVMGTQVNPRSYQDKQSGDWKEAEIKPSDIRTTQALWQFSDIILAVNTRSNDDKTKFVTRISTEKVKDADFCTFFLQLNKDELRFDDITKEDYYGV